MVRQILEFSYGVPDALRHLRIFDSVLELLVQWLLSWYFDWLFGRPVYFLWSIRLRDNDFLRGNI